MEQRTESGALETNRRVRCLACGSRFPAEADAPSPRRCPACARAGKPVDRLMRWIWQDLDEQTTSGFA